MKVCEINLFVDACDKQTYHAGKILHLTIPTLVKLQEENDAAPTSGTTPPDVSSGGYVGVILWSAAFG